jgi:folate-binding protein YgfZ
MPHQLPGSVFVHRSDWARLRLTGSDRAAFLHNMTTQEIKALAPGEGRPAAIVNQRAGVLDWVGVYAGETAHWVLGGPNRAAEDLAWLDRYLITEDVQLEDLGPHTELLYFTGPDAATIMARHATLEAFGHAEAHMNEKPVHVFATHGLDGAGFYLLMAPDDAPAVEELLMREGARIVYEDTIEAARIEHGLPALGKELGEGHNPWEGRLDASVSLSKGCYLGQEVVARLDSYDKVARFLVGLRWAEDYTPGKGASLLDGDREVGKLTSAIPFCGLGYVQTAKARPGQTLKLRDNGRELAVTVEDRPFWAGKTRAATFGTRSAP